MSFNIILTYFMFFTGFCLLDFITDLFCQFFSMRRCSYDCVKCRNWKCHFHYCQRKRLGMSVKEYKKYLASFSFSCPDTDESAD